MSGARASPGTAAYSAAKAGHLNLTGDPGRGVGSQGSGSTPSRPGMIRTEQAHLHYGDEAGIARGRRHGSPGQVGRAPGTWETLACSLASPLASYVSGAHLLVHGGGEKPAYLGAATNT